MKRIVYVLLAVTTFIACGEEKTDAGSEKTEEKKDSLSIEYSKELTALMQKFETGTFPYTVDTTQLNHIDKQDTLIGAEVKLLAVSIDKEDDLTSQSNSDRDDFFEIIELKEKGKYNAWAAKRDLGETKYASAFVLHKLKLNDSTDILTWAITYATYEACPYASGTDVYATVFYMGKPTTCMLIAQDYSAGDPPVGMTRTVTATIENETLKIHEVETSSDASEEEIVEEETKKDRAYTIAKGLFTKK